MSHHLRRFPLVASLSQRNANVEQLAVNFANEFANQPSDMYFQLANLICYTCKIPSLPQPMIDEEAFTAMKEFLKQLIKNMNLHSNIDQLQSLRQWPNVLAFFHYLIRYKWELLTNSCKFDSFFARFLNMLTDVELPVLRYFGVAVQVEFVTVMVVYFPELLRGENCATIIKFIINVLMNSFHDFERKIWTHCLLQMRQWFQEESHGLLKPEILRFIVWSLHDRLPTNVYLGLDICTELLNRTPQHSSLSSFVGSLIKSSSSILFTDNVGLFTKICDCAYALYNKYEVLSKAFMNTIFTFVFVPDRAKAKIAASFFLKTRLNVPSTFEQIRRIVLFLMHRNSILVELFVDAMIDVCDLLADWNALADAMVRLSCVEEQEMLLLTVICVIGVMIDGTKPYIRDEKCQIQVQGNISASITSKFAPVLDTIAHEDVSLCWKLLVIKLATYFDYNMVEDERLANILKEYLNTFSHSADIFDVTRASIILKLVFIILQRKQGEYIPLIVDLKTLYENEFMKLTRRIHQYTDEEYVASMNIVIGIYALRSIIPLDEKCVLNVPIHLLHVEESEKDNILLALCHEMAVLFCSEYAEELLTKKAEASNDELSSTLSAAEMENVKLVFNTLVECFDKHYCSRLGQLIYFALCRLARSLYDCNLDRQVQNSIFTEQHGECLAAYMSLVLGNLRFSSLISDCFDFNKSIIQNMIGHFSNLIFSDILPLSYACEFLRAYCCQSRQLEEQLRSFLIAIVEHRSTHDVAKWLFIYITECFELFTADQFHELLKQIRRLSQLLQSVRSVMAKSIERVHKLGIDYSLKPAATDADSELRVLSKPIMFLLVLSEFSPCLNAKMKDACYKYFQLKTITVADEDIAISYGKSLMKTKRKHPIDDDVESIVFSEDLNESETSSLRSRASSFDNLSSGMNELSISSDQDNGKEKRPRMDDEDS